MNPESIFDISSASLKSLLKLLSEILSISFARYSIERTLPHEPLAILVHDKNSKNNI